MRKVDPADVREAFHDEADRTLNYFDRVAVALKGTKSKEGDITILATNSFLALYVAFERFLSDLVLAYLNRDFSQYQAQLATKLQQAVRTNYGQGVASLVTFETKRHVKVAELESIVDPSNRNLTFANVADLKKRAEEWLGEVHFERIDSITIPEGRLIDTARSVRDFIAHGSPSSRQTMNRLLVSVRHGAHNRQLRRGQREIVEVGTYLKAVIEDRRRLHRYGDGLKAIATHI